MIPRRDCRTRISRKRGSASNIPLTLLLKARRKRLCPGFRREPLGARTLHTGFVCRAGPFAGSQEMLQRFERICFYTDAARGLIQAAMVGLADDIRSRRVEVVLFQRSKKKGKTSFRARMTWAPRGPINGEQLCGPLGRERKSGSSTILRRPSSVTARPIKNAPAPRARPSLSALRRKVALPRAANSPGFGFRLPWAKKGRFARSG